MIEEKEQPEKEINLTDEQAFELIENKRKSLGIDTWVASEVRVLKRGKRGDDNNYFYVEYVEENVDGSRSPLKLFFHYVEGGWEFSVPGFSGMTQETSDWLDTFVDIR